MDWIPALVELFREYTWQESEFRFRVSERMDVTGFSEGSCILTFIVHMADDEGVSWTVAMPKVDVDLQALLIEGVWSLTHFLRSHMWLRFATQTPTRSAGLFEMNGCKHEHPLVAYFKLFGWLCSGTALQGHLNGSKRGKWGWFVQSVCESKRKTKNIQRDFTTPLKLLTLASYKCSDCTGRKNKEQMWFENHASVLSHSFMSKKKKEKTYVLACQLHKSVVWHLALLLLTGSSSIWKCWRDQLQCFCWWWTCVWHFVSSDCWEILASITSKQIEVKLFKSIQIRSIFFPNFQRSQYLSFKRYKT